MKSRLKEYSPFSCDRYIDTNILKISKKLSLQLLEIIWEASKKAYKAQGTKNENIMGFQIDGSYGKKNLKGNMCYT